MKKILFLGLFLAISCLIKAQTTVLMGNVKDSTNQKSITFATVALYAAKDTAAEATPINAVLTDDKGRFEFEKVPDGTYRMEVAMLGYANFKLNTIDVKGTTINLAPILLKPIDTKSETVVITGLRPMVETKEDKIIYNLESDKMAQSGNVLEAMKKVPFVTVTADDKIMVKGQSSFKVLLNGKNTGILSKNPSEALKAFPANSIKKIEVITEPGAKYDAEGANAVINIITKKEVSGYNGGVYGNMNTFGRGNGGGYLNWKQNKFGLSGYLGGYNWNTPGAYSQDTRQSLDSLNRYTQITDGTNRFNGGGMYSNVELAYDIDTLKAISIYFGANPGANNSTSESHFQQLSENQYIQRTMDSYYTSKGNDMRGEVGADYIQKFGTTESEHELTFSTLYENIQGKEFYDNKNYSNPKPDRLLQNTNSTSNSEATISADYVLPFQKKHKFGTGLKAIQRNSGTDYRNNLFDSLANAYVEVPTQTNQFSYRQTIFSGYGEYILTLKKWTIKQGFRYEHTLVNGDFTSSQQKIDLQYGNLLPALLISFKPKPANMFKISYNKKISRPDIWYLNPFVNNSNPLFISYGNPNLLAERTHNISLGYNQFGNFGNINVSLDQAILERNIDQYVAFDAEKGVSTTSYYNMGGGYKTALRFYGSFTLDKKKNLSIYANAALTYNIIYSRFENYNYRNQGFTGNIYGNISYKLPKNFFLDAGGYYWSGDISLQGRNSAWYEYNIGGGKSFFDKKLSFTLQLQNPHAKYRKFVSTSESPSFVYRSESYQMARTIRFSVNYRFGSLQESVSRKKGISNEDKKAGGGGGGGK